jgi:hypothetical protein
MTMASAMARDALESVSFVFAGGEAIRTFLAFLDADEELASCFFQNSVALSFNSLLL